MTACTKQSQEIRKLKVGELTTVELHDLMRSLSGEGWTIHLLPQASPSLHCEVAIPCELTLCICRPPSSANVAES